MKRIPFLYRTIQGAIGKRFVIKHYKGGKIVMTKYPDMTGIVPSEEQKMCRRFFKRAVAYANKVYANPALKAEKRRLLRKPKRLFQALMKEWYAKRKEKDFYRQRRIARWQQNWQISKTISVFINAPQLACLVPQTSTPLDLRKRHRRTLNTTPAP